MENNKHIVAIDAGSSKISIAVGFESDQGFRILHYRALPSAGIHQGRIQNAQQASEVIQELIGGVKKELALTVNQAIVNLPSYPIVQRSAKAFTKREDDTMVQEQEIETLEVQARDKVLKQEDEKVGLSVYCCVSQSFTDGIDFPIGKDDIIGRFSDRIEGYYEIFLGNSRQMDNIDSTLGLQDLLAARKFFMPECVGKMVLDPTDVENGVALVDIGGDVTSVSIFTGGILRYYDSIPFGGRSVTMDIRNECGLSEALAENIKKAFGICCPDKLLSMSDKFLRIKQRDSTRTKEVGVKYLSEIVTARMREIFNAVLYIIQKSQLADELGSGIVLTGGGSMLTNCSKLLSEMSGYNVRVGRIGKRFAAFPKELQLPSTAGCLGLLYAGRGLNKVWFVSDPAAPRVNAIETETVVEEEKETDPEETVEPTPVQEESRETVTEEPEEIITLDKQPETQDKPLAQEKAEELSDIEKMEAEEKPETKAEAKAGNSSATAESGNLFGNSFNKPAAPVTPAKKKKGRLFDKIEEKFNSAFLNIMESDEKEGVGGLFGDDAF